MKLSHLFEELLPYSKDWENLGVLLDVPVHELSKIRVKQDNDPNSCLREMLVKWKEPSWETLVHVLEILGFAALADSIKTNYLTPK